MRKRSWLAFALLLAPLFARADAPVGTVPMIAGTHGIQDSRHADGRMFETGFAAIHTDPPNADWTEELLAAFEHASEICAR